MKKIYAIVKKPSDDIGRIIEIDNTLKALQDIVSGYIQAVPIDEDLAIICDEEGRLKHYPYNCDVCGIGFVGTIIVVGVNEDEFVDVPIGLDEWRRMISDVI